MSKYKTEQVQDRARYNNYIPICT